MTSPTDGSPGGPPPVFVVNTTAFVWHAGRYLMIVRSSTKEVAPGALTPPGGKLEVPAFAAGPEQDSLERNVRREVLEEVGVEVDQVTYVESHTFEGRFGGAPVPVVDVVFLTRYVSGEPVAQEEEVDGLEWLTPDAIRAHPRAMDFTLASMALAERVRSRLGWE